MEPLLEELEEVGQMTEEGTERGEIEVGVSEEYQNIFEHMDLSLEERQGIRKKRTEAGGKIIIYGVQMHEVAEKMINMMKSLSQPFTV